MAKRSKAQQEDHEFRKTRMRILTLRNDSPILHQMGKSALLSGEGNMKDDVMEMDRNDTIHHNPNEPAPIGMDNRHAEKINRDEKKREREIEEEKEEKEIAKKKELEKKRKLEQEQEKEREAAEKEKPQVGIPGLDFVNAIGREIQRNAIANPGVAPAMPNMAQIPGLPQNPALMPIIQDVAKKVKQIAGPAMGL